MKVSRLNSYVKAYNFIGTVLSIENLFGQRVPLHFLKTFWLGKKRFAILEGLP